MTKIVSGVLERNNIPGAVAGLVIGGKDVGEAVVESKSVDMGRLRHVSVRLVSCLFVSIIHGK